MANFRSAFKKSLNKGPKLESSTAAKPENKMKKEKKAEARQDRAMDFQREFSDNEELFDNDMSVE